MEKIEIIVKALDDKLATDIVILEMGDKSPLYDKFIICSGDNERLIQALKDNVEDEMEKHGFTVRKVEGVMNSRWVLMDFGDVIVHIFDPEERKLFDLEKLWHDVPSLDVTQYLK